MRVNLYSENTVNGRTSWDEVSRDIDVFEVLDESFDKMERIRLVLDLTSSGWCYIGGGAAQCFKLERVSPA